MSNVVTGDVVDDASDVVDDATVILAGDTTAGSPSPMSPYTGNHDFDHCDFTEEEFIRMSVPFEETKRLLNIAVEWFNMGDHVGALDEFESARNLGMVMENHFPEEIYLTRAIDEKYVRALIQVNTTESLQNAEGIVRAGVEEVLRNEQEMPNDDTALVVELYLRLAKINVLRALDYTRIHPEDIESESAHGEVQAEFASHEEFVRTNTFQ